MALRRDEIGWITCTSEQFAAMGDRLPEVYRAGIAARLEGVIDAGGPVLTTCECGWLVVGYDDATGAIPVRRGNAHRNGRPAQWTSGGGPAPPG